MANVINKVDGTLNVVFDAIPTDWVWSDGGIKSDGLLMESLEVIHTSTTYDVTIRDARDNDIILTRLVGTVDFGLVKYFNTGIYSRRFYPMVKSNERTNGVVLVIQLP